MIDEKTAQLTAINESLTVLEYGMATRSVLPADVLIVEAVQLLLLARKKYTTKPWPNLRQSSESRAYAVWHWKKQEEQQKDGRA